MDRQKLIIFRVFLSPCVYVFIIITRISSLVSLPSTSAGNAEDFSVKNVNLFHSPPTTILCHRRLATNIKIDGHGQVSQQRHRIEYLNTFQLHNNEEEPGGGHRLNCSCCSSKQPKILSVHVFRRKPWHFPDDHRGDFNQRTTTPDLKFIFVHMKR